MAHEQDLALADEILAHSNAYGAASASKADMLASNLTAFCAAWIRSYVEAATEEGRPSPCRMRKVTRLACKASLAGEIFEAVRRDRLPSFSEELDHRILAGEFGVNGGDRADHISFAIVRREAAESVAKVVRTVAYSLRKEGK